MYVVFDVDSTMEMRSYKQFHHAREYCRKLNEDENKDFPPGARNFKWKRTYDVQHVDFYNEYVVHWIQVKNLMSKQSVWIKSNTPLSCNPSSETYWSM